MNMEEMRSEALARAENGQSLTNYAAIIAGFVEKGIPESDIVPRVNVFTYRAWQAKGRQVRKGEHGVRVITYREFSKREKADDGSEKTVSFRRPWTATVFHVSQTDARA